MEFIEGNHPGNHQSSRPHEPSNCPYALAARFCKERLAKRSYFAAQETIRRAEGCDLSVYRFLLDQISHVAVIGESPPDDLDRRLRKILAAGELTALPADVLQLLFQRRAQASRQGSWLEGHYRPGVSLDREGLGEW